VRDWPINSMPACWKSSSLCYSASSEYVLFSS